VRSGQASAILLASLGTWLGTALIGFWLLMWPLVRGGIVPARLCLRSGFVCFREVARAMGFSVPDEPDPGAEIALSYQESSWTRSNGCAR
jgi:hypothetical protein